MSTTEIVCSHCEAEFYIETEFDILFCPSCGESLPQGEWNGYRDEEYDYDLEDDE